LKRGEEERRDEKLGLVGGREERGGGLSVWGIKRLLLLLLLMMINQTLASCRGCVYVPRNCREQKGEENRRDESQLVGTHHPRKAIALLGLWNQLESGLNSILTPHTIP